jgi:hypothetical protein
MAGTPDDPYLQTGRKTWFEDPNTGQRYDEWRPGTTYMGPGGALVAGQGGAATSPFASLGGGAGEAFQQRQSLKERGVAGLTAYAQAAGAMPSSLEKAQQAGMAELRRRAGQALAGSLGGGGRGVRGGAQSAQLREAGMSLGAQEATMRAQHAVDLGQAQQQAALAQFQAAAGEAAMGDPQAELQQQAMAVQQNMMNIIAGKGTNEEKAQWIEMLAAGAGDERLSKFIHDVAAQVRSGAL